jgi:lipoprotein NlpI
MGFVRCALARAALAVSIAVLVPSRGHAQSASPNTPVKEVQIAANAFSSGDPIPSWVDPIAIPQVGRPQPAVIRLLDTQFLADRVPVRYVRQAIMINDAASLTSAGQVSIQFVPDYQQLKLHSVRILRGGVHVDRTASSSIRFLQRETDLERGVYSGEVTASILVNDLRVGDTLEFSYSIHGQNPVFGDKFVAWSSWDQSHPTDLRRIVLNYSSDRQISWRVIGDHQPKPLIANETIHDGMRRLVLQETSLAKVDPERLMPPDHGAYRWVQFSEFSGWDEVAAWADKLFQVRGTPNQALLGIIETLQNKKTDEERVVGALEFVQSDIRYFSVSLGESSHRPTQPDVVLERRYGDCKDKSLLLMTLLHALNIHSKPVLLQVGRRKGLDKALPSPALFNHAIVQVMVGGDVFYLDPTRLGQHGRLRRMGQAHEGAQVLVVAPEVRQLSTIPRSNARDWVDDEIWETASLSKFEAQGRIQVRQVWSGSAAETLRVVHERLPREQINKSIGNALEARYPGAALVGEPNVEDDRINNVFKVTAQYDVPKLATQRAGHWFVRFFPPNMRGTLPASPSSTRTAPLHLPAFPYHAKYSFEMKFPEEVSVISDPRSQTVQSKYFTLTSTSSFRGNVSKNFVGLKTLAGQVEVADLQKYAEDVRSVANVVTGVVAVPKNAIKSIGSVAAAKTDFARLLRDRQQETIDKTTATIKSGKLTGSDLAASYCLRSTAYSDLGKTADALADANEALKATPNSSASLQCRAYAYFGAGEFDKSAADYSKAITLGATDARASYLRGISRYYAGKLDEAAEDFAKASDGPDDGLYSDLWLSWTYLRLGKPLPETVVKRAAAQPRGDWPRPALAVLTGYLEAQDMLKLLDLKSGDDRKMASSEGYFYLGQYYLARGDKAKAREYFEKTRRLNVIIYLEHTAAGFELQHLGPPTESGVVQSVEPIPKKTTKKTAPKSTDPWTVDLWKRQ